MVKNIRCRICGRAICKASLSFRSRMAKTRRHYARHHSRERTSSTPRRTGRRSRVSFKTGSGQRVSFLARRAKGQITLVGIMSILLVLIVFAITLPIQNEYIDIMYNSTNSTTNRLLILAIVPFELLMILMGIVYYGSSIRDQFRGYTTG